MATELAESKLFEGSSSSCYSSSSKRSDFSHHPKLSQSPFFSLSSLSVDSFSSVQKISWEIALNCVVGSKTLADVVYSIASSSNHHPHVFRDALLLLANVFPHLKNDISNCVCGIKEFFEDEHDVDNAFIVIELLV